MFFGKIYSKLDAILSGLGSVKKEQRKMTQDMETLKAQVQETTNAEASAVLLLQGLSERLRAAAEDPAAVKAIAGQLKSSAEALAEAVVANTPES